MNKSHFHPSQQDLLLYIDGEFPDRKAEQIRRHLGSCWDCRTQVTRIEATIVDFVDLRRKLLDRQIDDIDAPTAPAARSMLAARMEASAASDRAPVWQFLRLGQLPPAAFAAVAIAISLTALLVIQPLFVERISPSEVIAHALNAENQDPRNMVVHKRVRIRRTHKTHGSDVAVDYDFWGSRNRSRLIPASFQARPAAELEAIYRANGAEWQSPLSSAGFRRLRESLGEVRDEVSGRDFITLTSVPTHSRSKRPSPEIQRIALTVRKSDWQVVAQRVEVTGVDYEMTQLLGELVPSAALAPEIFGDPLPTPAPPSIARRPVETEAPLASAALPATPTDEQLETAEVLLHEALHRAGADIREFSTIQRHDRAIDLQLWVQIGARKIEILRALEQIPHLSPRIFAADAAGSFQPVESPLIESRAAPKLYSTQPPLAEALRQSLGGIDPANNYLDEVRDSYLRVFVEAGALGRLAQRYPDEQWNGLPSELRTRLNAVAADHISKIDASIPAYLKTVSLALADTTPASIQNGCDSWRIAIGDLLANLQGLQTSFLRLYVAERVETPVTLSAPDLLNESIQSRQRLQRNKLCQY